MSAKNQTTAWTITLVLVVLLVVAAIGTWQLYPVTVVAQANASRNFEAKCDYNKFRQIMVRTNATKSIIENGGMQLIDEKTNNIEIDATDDRRPILNAIRGRSKAELNATKIITVRLTDPQLNADELKLKQRADIDSSSMQVDTDSIEEAGNLKSYKSSLHADQVEGRTDVTLRVAMEVQLNVPRLFASQAKAQVQEAAENGLEAQEKALQTLVAEHADEKIILPDLK